MNKSLKIQLFAIIAIMIWISYFSLNDKEISSFKDLWKTPDQQAYEAFQRGDFAEAAKLYKNPILRGQALYKNAKFEEAAISFNQDGSAPALFNSGNSLLMMGKYDLAIKAYNRSLELDPNFKDAQFNKGIALNRKKLLDDAQDKMDEGTGGKLGADEIVFNNEPSSNKGESVTSEEQMTEVETNELWLRRVQTKPRDFLKIKFSYQLQKEAQERENE